VEINMEDYKREFLQEVKEYIDVLNQSFINVERGDKESLNEIFRVAHTIKGMAGFMGYKNLEKLCHNLESILGRIREESMEVNEEIIDVMLSTVDTIEKIISKIESEDSDEMDISNLLATLEGINKRSSENLKTQFIQESDLDYNLKLDVTLADDCLMKSVRVALILEALNDVARIVKIEPDEDFIDSDKFDGRFSIFIKGKKGEIERIMKTIGEVEKYEVIEIKTKHDTGVTKPINVEKLEKKTLESIRVNIEQLDTIMNLVGELVISKGRLLQISQHYNISELREAVNIMDKSITNLQDEIMRIRMIKIERVFNKFPRMVRDLARKSGKKIDFVMGGLDTELDRTVLDEINDPLVHIIRNAVDHGIEMPEERVAAGKSEVGRIILSARRDKNNIIIEIEDDGKGLDTEKIKKTAIERGLIIPSEAERMSDEEIKMLIFVPGFSTKDKPTEISGRGVGMDVVKTKVERLGGNVKVISEKDKGMKIRISLPPTVAIIKSLIVKVGDEDYAIPLSSVVEALYVNDANLKSIHGTQFLYVRSKLVPSFRLRELFNVRNGVPEKEIGIIIEKEGEKYGLIVDVITSQQEIVVKPLNGFLTGIKGFSGVTILGDGRVIPILDVSSLVGGEKIV